jgi:hypothetical protein
MANPMARSVWRKGTAADRTTGGIIILGHVIEYPLRDETDIESLDVLRRPGEFTIRIEWGHQGSAIFGFQGCQLILKL